jgi:hypothetical protein
MMIITKINNLQQQVFYLFIKLIKYLGPYDT